MQSKTWSLPFFLCCTININHRNWTSQAIYKKCLQIYKTSNLSHNKCGMLMILYLVCIKYSARWYAPISSSGVTIYVGSILVKEHHSGAHQSSSLMSMNSVSYSQFWWNRSHIPLQHIHWFCSTQLTVIIYRLKLVA